MPEIKNQFTGGKMNKDVDERLVPKGEYRDAMNIQVSTSEGSSVGTIQNILGNDEVEWIHNGMSYSVSQGSVCIGSISDEKDDSLYWFVKEPIDVNYLTATYGSRTWQSGVVANRSLILKYKKAVGISSQITPVVVDITEAHVLGSFEANTLTSGDIKITTFYGWNLIQIGDVINSVNVTGQQVAAMNIPVGGVKVISKNAAQNTITVALYAGAQIFGTSSSYSDGGIYLELNRGRKVLGFKNVDTITGVNIIDDMLFWTDNMSEPKKINIPRCEQGTAGSGLYPTLVVNQTQGLPTAPSPISSPLKLEERHITVIKNAPQNALSVKTETSPDFGFGVTSETESFLIDPNNPAAGILIVGQEITAIPLTVHPDALNLVPVVGDIILFNPTSESQPPEDEHQVKIILTQQWSSGVLSPAPILDSAGNVIPGAIVINFKAEVITIDSTISRVPQQYNWAIDWDRKQRFKDKFPRFSYRYKYQDNEYSSFGPFTNVIFEPGNFVYDVQDAYNIGMENRVTRITISDYNLNIPEDVKSIDLLYKESNSPTIYTIDTVKAEDLISTPTAGSYEIKPNQIRAVLPENQLLRPWDNVPKKALAQEVTGSRIIYGNYSQNYNLDSNPLFTAFLNDRSECDFNTGSFDGHKSLKSIRNYSLGISYLDKYGRQTPVFTNKQADIELPIDKSDEKNQVSIEPLGYIPEWATHYKIFVKEISSEYYNLAMDRIYDARDGNIWLSFPSSDRNKVDEETFLILKKGVEGAQPVNDDNRYKILAIENEAPDFIKTEFKTLGTVREDGSGNFPGTYFSNVNGYPILNAKKIIIDKSSWDTVGLSLEGIGKIEVRFSVLVGSTVLQESKQYEIVNFGIDDSAGAGNEEYELVLKNGIEEQWLSDTNNLAEPDKLIGITIYKKEVENRPQFDGRFFVKVARDIIIDDYIVSQAAASIITQQVPTVQIPFYYLSDSGSWNGNDTSSAISGISGNKTSTKNEWEAFYDQTGAAKSCWFIDQAYFGGFIAPSEHSYLQERGIPYFGSSSASYDNTDKTMADTGYNKGIWTDNNGQTWLYLSFGYIKHSYSDGYTNSDIYLQNNSPSSSQNLNAQACWLSNWDPTGNGCDLKALTGGTYDWEGNDDNIHIWKVGDQAANPIHGDEADAVLSFSTGKKFKFLGDPDNTIYTIIAPPELYYHFSYYNLDDLDNEGYGAPGQISVATATAAGASSSNIQPFYDGTEIYIKAIHKIGHSRNRRATWRIPINANPTDTNSTFNPIASGQADASNTGVIQFLEQQWFGLDDQIVSENPAVWETEPKQDVDLDIYYEIDSAYPLEINEQTNNSFAPPGTIITVGDMSRLPGNADGVTRILNWQPISIGNVSKSNVIIIDESILVTNGTAAAANWDQTITFHRPDGSCVRSQMIGWPSTFGSGGSVYANQIEVDPDVSHQPVSLAWFNCYSFQNGVESDRIRDDYNQVRIDKGAKASSTLEEPYEEEYRKYGLIYSGLYNSISGVNNLNQFIAAEKITKDINPNYGTIQKLHSRSTADGDLIVLCEDRVLKVLADKDAVFNADGNTNLTATENVLGQAIPYSGEYGISKNPESFASESYRVYFTDKVRGAVMRLSKDGLTAISDHGMKDWFRDNLKLSNKLTGSFDDKKDEYNITLDKTVDEPTKGETVSFREDVKGWVSFKSFIPEHGDSCANEYYTFLNGRLFMHHVENMDRNTFYDGIVQTPFTPSLVEFVFNDVPGSVKSFKTINYEGSQAKVNRLHDSSGGIIEDNEYFNLRDVEGWYVGNVFTDLETGSLTDFVEKEGKWFGYIVGNDVTINNVGVIDLNFDTSDFSIQGIGTPTAISSSVVFGCTDPAAFNFNAAASNDDGSCVDIIYGCMDQNAHSSSYNPLANTDDGSCLYFGCTNSSTLSWAPGFLMINYDPNANFDDGTCVQAVVGCLDGFAFNYNPLANASCGGDYPLLGDPVGQAANYCCEAEVIGCLDTTITASNYDASVNSDDGSCEWLGCTDPLADNYSFTGSSPVVDGPNGNFQYLNGIAVDDISNPCTYPGGCVDPAACNYDPTPGVVDNGSCTYCGDSTSTGVLNYDGGTCNTGCEYCECSTPVPTLAINPSETINGVEQYNGNVTVGFTESVNAFEYRLGITSGPLAGLFFDFSSSSNPYNHGLGPGGAITATGFGSGIVEVEFTNLPAGTYNFIVTAVCNQNGNNSFFGGGAPVDCGNYNAQPYPILPPTDIFIIGSNDVTPGCTDPTACNFNPAAVIDDGTCVLGSNCTGCTDNAFLEFCNTCWDSTSNVVVTNGGGPWVFSDPSQCVTQIVLGCTDSTAFNYNAAANVDDGSCVAVVLGCTDGTLNNNGTFAASNYNALANTDDGSCNSYNCPILSSNSSQMAGNSPYRIAYDVSNTPYSANLGLGGLPNPSNLTAGFSFADNNGVVNGGNVPFHYSGGIGANASGLDGFNFSSTSYIFKQFGIGNFGSSNNNELGVQNNNLTSIYVGFNITTADGNCSVDLVETLTIGCNDATATNSGSTVNGVDFNITDNSQCIYTGCMDATPSTDGVDFFATNYDPSVSVPCQTHPTITSLSGDNACCAYPFGTSREWTAFNDLSPVGDGYSALVIADDYSGTAFTSTDHYIKPGTATISTTFTSQYDGSANNASGTTLVPAGNSFGSLLNSNVNAEGLPIAGVLQADCSSAAANSIQGVPCIEWGPYLVVDPLTQTATLDISDIQRDHKGSGTQGTVVIDNASRGNSIGPWIDQADINETFTVGCKIGGYNNIQPGEYWNRTNQVDLNDSSMCILEVEGCADPQATAEVVGATGGLGTYGFYNAAATVNCYGNVIANVGIQPGCCCYDCATPAFDTPNAIDNVVSNTQGTGASHLDLHWTPVPYARHYIVEFARTDATQVAALRVSFIVDSNTPGFSTGDITIDADYILQNLNNGLTHLSFEVLNAGTPQEQTVGMFEDGKEFIFYIKADCDTMWTDPSDPTQSFLNQCAYPNEHHSNEDDASIAIQI